jgi:hypothetical protein
MSWTTAGDLKEQVRRLWDRGELLRRLIDEQMSVVVAASNDVVDRAFGSDPSSVFPLRLALKGPTSTELAERFQAVRSWISELVAVTCIRIEWREFNHRILGAQRVPQSIWVDNLDGALAMIGKRNEAARFNPLLALVCSRQPALRAWFRKRPLQALALAEECEHLLAVVDWMAQHPRPGIYLRQVDIPGVHSKFIENWRGVLTEWLDLILPPEAISKEAGGTGQFAVRYGFNDKPVRIRFRVLDAKLGLLTGPALPDMTLDADSFAKLNASIRRVFITENETNFLAFPCAVDAIVVFGAGYGWDALANAAWLADCSIQYWGDIDTHGFAILDQLRARFDHVESFLMDRPTLMAHRALWGEEANQVMRDLPRLNDAERMLFDDLRDNRIRKGLRLEQERIGFRWVETALGSFLGLRR